MSIAAPSPVRLEGRLDPQLSRWLWLFKWLLILPHAFVLVFLWAAFLLLTVVAVVAVAFTGRYPRAIFDFNCGVLRWTWRVGFYAYSALGTDRYPPFTLEDVPDYPARLELRYPEHLPRGWRLLRWWVIALPHYVIAGLFLGGPWFVGERSGWASTGLVATVAIMAGVVLLFTGRYPRGLFDFEMGLDRWVLRAGAYAALLTDQYPPLRLDTGTERVTPPAPAAAAPAGSRRRSGLATAALVIGSVAALVAIGLTVAGSSLLVVDATGRDDNGYLSAPAKRYETHSYALTASPGELHLDSPGWLDVASVLGSIRLRATGGGPVFVGIARTRDLASYLGGVRRAVITDPANGRQRIVPGAAPGGRPGEQRFWVASAVGAGRRTVTWKASSGRWSVVIMNADGSPGVSARIRTAATLPHLGAVGGAALGGGILLGALAAVLLVAGLPAPRHRSAASGSSA